MDAAANSYRRFLDGDESAFEEIMQELFCGLVFFINGFVHDPHAAEDIAIDAFSDLVVHRHRYNFRVSLKTYLYMVGAAPWTISAVAGSSASRSSPRPTAWRMTPPPWRSWPWPATASAG